MYTRTNIASLVRKSDTPPAAVVHFARTTIESENNAAEIDDLIVTIPVAAFLLTVVISHHYISLTFYIIVILHFCKTYTNIAQTWLVELSFLVSQTHSITKMLCRIRNPK